MNFYSWLIIYAVVFTTCSYPEFLSTQQLINNGLYKSMLRLEKETNGEMVKRSKGDKEAGNEKPKCSVACCSFCGWGGCCIAASTALPETETLAAIVHHKTATSERTEISTALASAAALVASRCIEIAEEMGADHDHILSVFSSAVYARTNGDIMTLTPGAATGDLHWKQVSFNTNSNGQDVAKMKSKHMVGTFSKKKCVVYGVCCDVAAWPGREREDCSKPRAYFCIKTADMTIEFECQSIRDKHMWIEGIQNMLNLIST